jgi:peptide/nickel transport system substrate-binding protein
MIGRSRGVVRCLLGVIASTFLAFTASAAEVAIGLKTEPSAIDPHFAILGANQQISEQIFDTLVGRDEKLRSVPALATAWRLLDETTWEFTLRPGVLFHDGTQFTAADAVFTIARAPAVPNSPASYAPYVSHIAEAVAVDDLTLRIRTKGPYPTLPLDLSELYIVSKKAAEHATTDDFNKGKAAIGTGAYRFVEWLPGQRLVLARNDAYWGAKPAIERVVFRVLPSDPSRVAALLAGDVSLIEAVPPADLAQLRKNPSVAVWSAASTRLIYLHMDTSRAATPFVADKAGAPLPANPLLDRRVRLALSKAINRQAIVDRILEGSASIAGQMVPQGLVGWNPALVPEPYDPDGAKKLLAEAGYPGGFRLTLHGPNNRYVGDEKVALAIAQMWARIGVETRVETMPSNVFFTRATKQEFSIFLIGFGSATGDSANGMRNVLASYDAAGGTGANNRGRYSNPEFDRLLAQADRTLDPAAREKTLQEAAALAFGDVAIIPIEFQANDWATRKGFRYHARMDETTTATDLAPE